METRCFKTISCLQNRYSKDFKLQSLGPFQILFSGYLVLYKLKIERCFNLISSEACLMSLVFLDGKLF